MLSIQLTARANDNSRWAWTMFAIAVRIAHALGLHKLGHSPPTSVFDYEQRCRLWHAIRLIDAHTSNDRGSDPMIPEPEHATRLPLNIEVSDISPQSTVFPPEREGITEMTLSLLVQSCTKYFWRLFFLPPSDLERPPTEIQSNWDLR